MEALDTLRAQFGAKQINTTGSDVDIRFNSFIADEGTVLTSIYVDREGVETEILSELTDNASAGMVPGVLFRAFQGDIFTKVNISAGRIVVYLEPNK